MNGISAQNEWKRHWLRRKLAAGVFLTLFCIYSLARESICPFGADAQRAKWRLAGDEPAYLLTAQAIASGHGEDVSKVHAARTYTNYWHLNKTVIGPRDCLYEGYERLPCVKFRFNRREAWGSKQILHGGFLEPLFCAPFALSPSRPRWKILLAQGLIAALAGAAILLVAPGGDGAARIQALAIVFILGAAPPAFYTAQIYPETLIGVLLTAFLMSLRAKDERLRCAGHLCLFFSLFGSSRIAGAAFAAEAVCLWRAIRRGRKLEALAIVFGSLSYFGYHVWRWGNFYPPNTDMKSPITPSLLPRGLMRYLFGNSCGMIPLAPATWAGLVALVPLLKMRKSEPMAMPCAIIALGTALSVAMFPTFRAGRCAAGRYQVACVWALLPAILVVLGSPRTGGACLKRIRSSLLLLGPPTLALSIWLCAHPRWWHEYFHPFFKPEPLQEWYSVLPNFSGMWRPQLASMLAVLCLATFAPDLRMFIAKSLRMASSKLRPADQKG